MNAASISNRARSLALVALVLATAALTAAPARAGSGEVGSEAWGQDNCLYVWNGSAWQSASVCRVFPDRRNAQVWDQYSPTDPQRRAVSRVTASSDGWIYVHDYTSNNEFAFPYRGSLLRVDPAEYFVLGPGQQWMTLAQVNAAIQQGGARRDGAFIPDDPNKVFTVGGDTSRTPQVSNAPGSVTVGGANGSSVPSNCNAACQEAVLMAAKQQAATRNEQLDRLWGPQCRRGEYCH